MNFGIGGHSLNTSYFIGVGWLEKGKVQIEVYPKLDKNEDCCTDYHRMVREAFKHPDAWKYVQDMVEIKSDAELIEVDKHNDLITPLLIAQFTNLIYNIVRKGLLKGYYKRSVVLNSRVKGKVEVGATIKSFHSKGDFLKAKCSYEEFGVNCDENRILKKALNEIRNYFSLNREWFDDKKVFSEKLNYIFPAFEFVDSDINHRLLKHNHRNALYHEYEEGIKLARIIINRLGYNINSARANNKVMVPAYWIDMSKLFELYVLGLLYERYSSSVHYQVTGAGVADYVVNGSEKMVIDAKYKLHYSYTREVRDMMQVSGYARSHAILNKLGIPEAQRESYIPDCLIIYPDPNSKNTTLNDLPDIKEDVIKSHVKMFKVGVHLPTRPLYK